MGVKKYYMIIYCKCGCNLKVKRGNEFILGHNSRGKNNPMYGKVHKLNCQCYYCKAKRGEYKGENNPMFGKIHRKDCKCSFCRDKSGKNNPMFGKRGKNNPMYGKHHTEKTKFKISKTRSQKLAEGIIKPNTHSKKGYYLSKLTNIQEYFHSSYELERMKQLDKNGIWWTKKHKIFIEYKDLYENKRHTIPDFLVNTSPQKTIEETKNYLSEDTYWKCLKTKEWCKQNNYNYILLFKKDIFKEEIK